MPVVLPDENWAKWLGDESASSDELTAMLKPCPHEMMQAYAVSRLVNKPENEMPALIDPVQ